MKFAVIETGGKQYRVSPGQKIKVEKLNAPPKGEARHNDGESGGSTLLTAGGSTPVSPELVEGLTAGAVFSFDKVLLRADGEKVEIGTPYVSGAKVEGKVLRQARERKKIVFKYHAKARYRKKKGHRQHFTEVEIKSV